MDTKVIRISYHSPHFTSRFAAVEVDIRGMFRDTILSWTKPFIEIPTFGLDISDQGAKYAEVVRTKAGLRLASSGELTIPRGIIVDGEIKKEKELQALLREWLAKDGRALRSSWVVASLPEEKSFLRMLQIPKVKRDAVADAIRWEIESNIPLPVADLVYDYEIIEPLEDHLDHLDIMIIAFPKAIVESYAATLAACGLSIAALELESQAIIRATLRNFREKSVTIVVDVGRSRTSFIIFSGGALIFTTTVKVGGEMFEAQIARILGVAPNEAIALKKEWGLSKRAFDGKVYAALAPTLSVLADEMRQAIRYYRDHTAHTHGASQTIDTVLLTGGDANLLGLSTFLASILKIPVRTADPFSEIGSLFSHPIPPITKTQALASNAPIGLALRGIR